MRTSSPSSGEEARVTRPSFALILRTTVGCPLIEAVTTEEVVAVVPVPSPLTIGHWRVLTTLEVPSKSPSEYDHRDSEIELNDLSHLLLRFADLS